MARVEMLSLVERNCCLIGGLEVKREVLIGQLSSRAKIILPGVAALGVGVAR